MAQAVLLAGLGFGDEGKGALTDALTRALPVDTIVRYGGGCQCAHNVVTPEGVHHTFAQFGSGMLANNTVKTHLSRFMLVEPFAMMREADALNKITNDVWPRTTVDAKCVIVTNLHAHLNRMRELARGDNRHGSCGRGIGVAREMQLRYGGAVLMAGDLKSTRQTIQKLAFMYEEMEIELRHLEKEAGKEPTAWWKYEDLITMASQIRIGRWPAQIVDGLEPAETMVFEGAQGVMLDETHGTAPHNTWTDTTFNNADTLLDELGIEDRYRIGCLRTYHTRHGAGPFPTEDNSLDLPEPHNGVGEFQGAFRVGHFDFSLAKRALNIVGGVDSLALSHMDYLPRLGCEENYFLTSIAANLQTPVGMIGRGPAATDREIMFDMERVGA